MRKAQLLSFAVCALIAGMAGAQTPSEAPPNAPPPPGAQPPHPKGPCGEILAACEGAGFVKGDYRAGNGLWGDCIAPIMQGRSEPANGKLPLPQVSPDVIAACKARNPRFGLEKGTAPAPPPPPPPPPPAQ
jgi:hypothetical protein